MFKFTEKIQKNKRMKKFEKSVIKTEKMQCKTDDVTKKKKKPNMDKYVLINKDNKKVVVLSKKIKLLLIMIFIIELFSLVSLGIYNSGIFNKKLEIQMFSEKEIVKTGEIHKVTIKSSYSNPNDKGSEKVRIYLEDGNGVPNTKAKILNMENNKIEFSSERNPYDNVILEEHEEKDDEGKLISRYLEYYLGPGTTVNMELEFTVDSGYNGPTEILELVPDIDDEKIQEEYYLDDGITIEKVYKPIHIAWEAEYKWSNFEINTNATAIGYDSRNKFSTDEIEYTYLATNENTAREGLIYTKDVELETKTELPSNFTFVMEDAYRIENNKIINNNDALMYEVSVADYEFEVESLEVKKGDNDLYSIISKIKITNPEETDNLFNPIDKIKTKLCLNYLQTSNLNYDEKIISHDAKFTANSVVLGVLYEDTATIENGFSSNGELTISKSVVSVLDTRGDEST